MAEKERERQGKRIRSFERNQKDKEWKRGARGSRRRGREEEKRMKFGRGAIAKLFR
jgi:hypothetical protein